MEIYQIRYFLAMCKTLNFSKAAELCNVSQPALTRGIQKLEEELGGILFRRERNLTHLSDFGHLLMPQLERIMTDTESVRTTASEFLTLDKASINLGIMCTIGPARFIGFLEGFRAAKPGVELSLIEGVPVRLSDMILDGKLDVAIMAQPGPFNERLNVDPLYKERFCVAFPMGHRFESQDTVHPAELAGESYLTRINCEFENPLDALCTTRGVKLRETYRSEREDWIQMMVAAGFGLCFLPEFSPVIPGVVTRPVEPGITREISLVSIAGRHFSPAITSFVKAVRTHDWGRYVRDH
ncbi:MAG: LysR substrate-binding domain-containing protein, partial [Alphaproteobacteria bacterium]